MKEGLKAKLPGIVVLTCAMIVIAWQTAGLIAQREGDDFTLQADDFDSFELKLDGWKVDKLEVSPTFMEVNLLKYRLRSKQGVAHSRPLVSISGSTSPQILIRLVHGYNMRDCMRIKGYTVDEINSVPANSPPLRPPRSLRETSPSSQLWRLTSATGDASLWMSGMLRAGDFSETDLSTTDMAFPRIGIPDDPSWMPRGLTLKSFRHPIRNFKYFMRAKWNNSRCDLLTFLGLRKPAWASDDDLTFLVIWVGGPIETKDEEVVSDLLTDVYRQTLPQLQEWKSSRTEFTEDAEGE